jgi:predicted DNA-binding ribbon-helix-helix protein
MAFFFASLLPRSPVSFFAADPNRSFLRGNKIKKMPMMLETQPRTAMPSDQKKMSLSLVKGNRMPRGRLTARNINIDARRTSMRLEAAMWIGLEEICRRERVSLHNLCTWISAQRSESTLTGSVRIFVLNYFVAAATEDGHARAGHGTRIFRDKLKYGSAPPIAAGGKEA